MPTNTGSANVHAEASFAAVSVVSAPKKKVRGVVSFDRWNGSFVRCLAIVSYLLIQFVFCFLLLRLSGATSKIDFSKSSFIPKS